MRILNPFMCMLKKLKWNCKFWILVDEVELMEEFAFNLTPSAKREIKKIIYQHFDLIVETWNIHFKKH
jgi:hypothetical protein